MTAAALAQLFCLAAAALGRPADPAVCSERATQISAASARHNVDPILVMAIDVWECDLRTDRDAPVYKGSGSRRRLVGYDACPMGYRVIGIERRRHLGSADLYELGAAKLESDRRRCRRLGHRHHFLRHWNFHSQGYAEKVLAVDAALRGRGPSGAGLGGRAGAIVRKISSALGGRKS